jgi:hypothetical protein
VPDAAIGGIGHLFSPLPLLTDAPSLRAKRSNPRHYGESVFVSVLPAQPFDRPFKIKNKQALIFKEFFQDFNGGVIKGIPEAMGAHVWLPGGSEIRLYLPRKFGNILNDKNFSQV